jgi:hypothetical protein
MRIGLQTSLALLLLVLNACQSGLSGLVSSDSLKSDQSQNTSITPRTKGSTLEGIVIWPQEMLAPASLQFEIRIASADQTWTTLSDSQGHFQVNDLQWKGAAPMLRVEAKAMHNPQLVLKTLFQTQAIPTQMNTQITLTSTATVALLDQAQGMKSMLMNMAPERLNQVDTQPLVEDVKNAMMPYLNTPLTQPLEHMPEVQKMLEETVQKLEKMPGMLTNNRAGNV